MTNPNSHQPQPLDTLPSRTPPAPGGRRARGALLLGAAGAGLAACLWLVPTSWASTPAPSAEQASAFGKGGSGGKGGSAGGCSSF